MEGKGKVKKGFLMRGMRIWGMEGGSDDGFLGLCFN